MIFQIRIAEKNIKISSLHEKVFLLCRDYLNNDDSIDFEIIIHQQDINYEREICQENAEEDRKYSDAYLETLAVYRKIALKMLDYDTFLMHGSVVAVDDEAYIFLATSGTGKTTHSRLWLNHIPGASIVNGDKPLIMIRDGVVYACGTPWCGKESYQSNRIVSIQAIYSLSRAQKNSVKEISFGDIFPMLLQQTYKPKQAEAMIKTLNLLHKMSHDIKYYDLKCNMDKEAAIMAYQENQE